ncbi:TPA: hypothetical protein ACJ2XI_002369 [Klebsiella quasipneumoniae]
MTKKHNYTLNLNTVTEALMVCKLDMNVEESQFLLHYRDKFKLLEGDGSALVNLEELWEALDCPRFTHSVHVGKTADKYKRAKSQAFSEWFNEVALPTLDRLKTQICVIEQKTPGRGANKKIRSIDTETAKALAMMANNEAGDTVRRYFILIEKLFKRICEYNDLRISIEQSRKDACSNWYQSGNIFKGQEESKRYNWIMKEVIGKRNDLSTDLEEYEFVGKTVARMMRNGASDDVIFSAVSYVK